MRKRLSLTQTSRPANRRPSAPPDLNQPQPQPPLRSLRYTSQSTSTCFTMPSMRTLARCTSVTSTASLSCCMRCLETPKTREDQLYSGATPTQGVCIHQFDCQWLFVTDCSSRPRKRCMHSCLLHDFDPELAAASCFGPHRPDGPSMHAIPRCWLQSS